MARTLLLGSAIGSIAVAALVWPVAALIAAGAVRAQMIAPLSPDRVEVNRGMFELEGLDPSAPGYAVEVTKIYGTPVGEPMDFLFVAEDRLLRPEEMPELVLLPVDKSRGENPLQAGTVYFFAFWASVGAGGVGVVLAGAWMLLKGLASRRRPVAA